MMIEKYFPVRRDRVSRKRFRGKKRYYLRILREAKAFSLPFESGDWFDHWHYHADWPGQGNLGWRHRKLHIQALCIVFGNIVQQLMDSSMQYQLWLFLDTRDAGQDAVYFHTPNPNRSDFPMILTDTIWKFPELEFFAAQWLNPLPLSAGIGVWEGNQQYFLYSLSHGYQLSDL